MKRIEQAAGGIQMVRSCNNITECFLYQSNRIYEQKRLLYHYVITIDCISLKIILYLLI